MSSDYHIPKHRYPKANMIIIFCPGTCTSSLSVRHGAKLHGDACLPLKTR